LRAGISGIAAGPATGAKIHKEPSTTESLEKPRWLRDLLRFLPLKSQFVLSGNVRDLQASEVAPGIVTAYDNGHPPTTTDTHKSTTTDTHKSESSYKTSGTVPTDDE
jgi:hypothetical protein